MDRRKALNQYNKLNTQTLVADADPHKLIQMLFDGAIDRLAAAKGHVQRKEYEARNNMVNKAIAIIGGLQDSLNMEHGGEIAANLFSLYDYMTRKLFEANACNNENCVDEVLSLLSDIREGWASISDKIVVNG